MKPQILIDRATTPDGTELVLYERDGVFTIRVNGDELMSSRAHGSEEEMAASRVWPRSRPDTPASWSVGSEWATRCEPCSIAFPLEPGHRRRTAARDRPMESRPPGRSGRVSPRRPQGRAGRRRRRQVSGIGSQYLRRDPPRCRQRPGGPHRPAQRPALPRRRPAAIKRVSAARDWSGPRRPIKNTNGSNLAGFHSRLRRSRSPRSKVPAHRLRRRS